MRNQGESEQKQKRRSSSSSSLLKPLKGQPRKIAALQWLVCGGGGGGRGREEAEVAMKSMAWQFWVKWRNAEAQQEVVAAHDASIVDFTMWYLGNQLILDLV